MVPSKVVAPEAAGPLPGPADLEGPGYAKGPAAFTTGYIRTAKAPK